jgi:metal-responsive CopG/Arc/MetJ family transcriptional regulator
MESKLRSERVTIMMSPGELKTVDDWSFQQRLRSRGEAIRQLIELGLEAAKQRQKEKA